MVVARPSNLSMLGLIARTSRYASRSAFWFLRSCPARTQMLRGSSLYRPRHLENLQEEKRIHSKSSNEAACRDQIPYLWLTGWQHPDHNTLASIPDMTLSLARTVKEHL